MSEWAAYHESGHAMVAILMGARVQSVTIEPDWDDGPSRSADAQIAWPLDKFSERELHEKMVRVALAGPVAEMLYRGEPLHPGFVAEWAADWKMAWDSAASLIQPEPKRLAFLEQVSRQLYEWLDRTDHWAALAAVADNLLAHETLEGDVVEDIVNQWLR